MTRTLEPWLAMSFQMCAVRAGLGVVAGVLVGVTDAAEGSPTWWRVLAALVLGVVWAVAPGCSRWAGRGITSGWVLASAIGLYVGVPETDRIVAATFVLAVLWLAEVGGRLQVDGMVVGLLTVVLVWLTFEGSAGRSGAFVAGLATIGLIVVAPAVRLVVPSARPPAAWSAPVLLVLQLGYAIGVARLGGIRTSLAEATVVSVAAVVLLAIITTVVFRIDGGNA